MEKSPNQHHCILLNRLDFYNRCQSDEETLLDYLIDVYRLSKLCEFHGDAELLIRDRLVFGMIDTELQQKLLSLAGNPTLEKVMETCQIDKINFEGGKALVDADQSTDYELSSDTEIFENGFIKTEPTDNYDNDHDELIIKVKRPRYTQNENDAMSISEHSENGSSSADTSDFKIPKILSLLFKIIKVESVTITVQCSCCNSFVKGYRRSFSNIYAHLKKMHPEIYAEYAKLIPSRSRSIQRRPDADILVSSAITNTDTNNSTTEKALVLTQSEFEYHLFSLIVKGMNAISLVDDTAFKEYTHAITTGSPDGKSGIVKSHYTIPNSNAIMKQITDQFVLGKKEFCEKIKDINYLCAANEILVSRNETYIGVTIYWLDPMSFEWRWKSIACRPFQHDSNENALISQFNAILADYDIQNKIFSTVTNNAHKNIVRIEKELKNALQDSKNDYEIPIEISIECLPSPNQCACDALTFIVTKSLNNALTEEPFRIRHLKVFQKLEEVWSLKTFKKAKSVLPSITRPIKDEWDSIVKSIKIISMLNQGELINFTEKCSVEMFSKDEVAFLIEYVKILEPIALAMGNLKKACYYAVLLPTIHTVRAKMLKLRHFKICSNLSKYITQAFEAHFGYLLNVTNEECISAVLATCSHPFFKTRWLQNQSEENLKYIETLFVSTAKKMSEFEDGQDDDVKNETVDDDEDNDEDSGSESGETFKYCFSSKVSKGAASERTQIHLEVIAYLNSPSENDERNLEELDRYKHIKNIFLKYNTILLSFAPKQQLTPIAKEILRRQRENLTDDLFEKILILTAENGFGDEKNLD